MELAVLVDNNTHLGNCLISEHGLSFLIKEDEKQVLFDCGSTDAFIKNAYKMNMDLENITDIVLSHSHKDHVGGFVKLRALYANFKSIGLGMSDKNVITHPDVFNENLNNDAANSADSGMHFPKSDIEEFFNLKLTKDPYEITPKLIYLGEIPIKYNEIKQDYSPDETVLAYKSKDGLIIISGCSHSGIENIVEQARVVTGEKRIHTIIGGFYLINRDGDDINNLGRYLQEQGVKLIYPCHCTDLESKIILSKFVMIKEVSTGRKYHWE